MSGSGEHGGVLRMSEVGGSSPEAVLIDALSATGHSRVVGTDDSSGGTSLRATPSAGSCHPVEAHLLVRPPGAPPRLGRLDPLARRLRPLTGHDPSFPWRERGPGRGACPVASVVLSAVPWRSAWKYGPAAYRQVLWDTGAALACLEHTAARRGVATRRDLVLDDDLISSLLGLEQQGVSAEVPVAVLHLAPPRDPSGSPSPLWEAAPATVARTSGGTTTPVAAAAVMAAHRRTTVRSGDVAAASAAIGGSPGWSSPTVPVQARATELGTRPRRSRDGPVSGRLHARRLAELLGEGTSRAEAVTATLVHDVPGLTSGLRTGGSLRRAGTFRGAAAQLCQGQEAARGASAVAFLGLDVAAALARGGAAGYRATQVALGAAATELHLRAHEAGVPGSVLTLFEDLARAALVVEEEPQLAVTLF